MSQKRSIPVASGIMILLALLLFWLPVLGPFLAGLAGGRMAGNMVRGFIAALLPALVLALVLMGAMVLFGLPFLGVLAGSMLFLYLLFNDFALLSGAVLGGALASS